MLRKLYKHEFNALARSLWPVYLGLLALSVFNRVFLTFGESDNKIINTISNSIMMFYVLGILAIFTVSIVIVVVRFYQHLMTSQGYLSFTLPVKVSSHIICKLVCGTIAILLSAVAVILSLMIISIGTNQIALAIDAIAMAYTQGAAIFGAFRMVLFTVGVVVLIIVTTAAGLLIAYGAIALGQQFKNRIGGAVLSFVGISMGLQVISALSFVPFMVDFANKMTYSNFLDSAESMGNFISITIGLCILWALIIGVGMYFLSNHMLSKKLNLE